MELIKKMALLVVELIKKMALLVEELIKKITVDDDDENEEQSEVLWVRYLNAKVNFERKMREQLQDKDLKCESSYKIKLKKIHNCYGEDFIWKSQATHVTCTVLHPQAVLAI